MKIFNANIKFLTLLTALILISFSACQKESEVNDLTVEITGDYIGEYREGEDGFTVIVSNVESTAAKDSDDSFSMEMELVAGLVFVNFDAELRDKNNFTIQPFDLDGNVLEGEGSLQEGMLEIVFYEEGTENQYATYIAQKQ